MLIGTGTYGSTTKKKPRVGLLIPSVQTVTEPLFHHVLGDEFDFIANKVRLHGGRVEDMMDMESDIASAVDELMDAEVDLLVYCCTVSGAIQGREKEEQRCECITKATSVPMTSTMLSCVRALNSLSAKKISLISPSIAEKNHIEKDYFSENGFEVVNIYGFGIVDGSKFSLIPPEDIREKALENWDSSADAMFISCMNWRAFDVQFDIQCGIGKPVVASHAATLWSIYSILRDVTNYAEFMETLQKKH